MKKNVKKTFKAGTLYLRVTIALLTLFLFSFLAGLLTAGKAYAEKNYFNDFYVSINGGIGDTKLAVPSVNFPSRSGGTYNLAIGKDWDFTRFGVPNFILGGEVYGGYSSYGSFTAYTSNGIIDAKTSAWYYAADVKAGYVINRTLMPFLKGGYIGYNYSWSLQGPGAAGEPTPFSNRYGFLYGGGVEYNFYQNWGVTLQYIGTSLNSSSKTSNYTLGIVYAF